MRSVQQVLTLIKSSITDALLRQNTALRVRTVLNTFATDYFNKESDSLKITQVIGLADALSQSGRLRMRIDFADQDLVLIEHGLTIPPITQVFDLEGYELGCQRRILDDGNIEIQFTNPETGFIIY
jgi:hypothetical protein